MKNAYINGFCWLSTALAVSLVASTAASAAEELTMWSHWPDELSKRGFVENRVSEFEASNPQCKVDLQFIQKAEIYTAAKISVRTGQAPDIFWLEPDQTEYIDGGYLEPLDSYIDLDNDGRLDLVFARNDTAPEIYLHNPNASGNTENRSLRILLKGSKGNPTGIGSKITLHVQDGNTQSAEIHAGSGYLTQTPTHINFGLGKDEIATIQVQWPSGKTSTTQVSTGTSKIIISSP